MRRITLWVLSTVSLLVLLFSYRTSTMGVGGTGSSTVASAGGSAGGDQFGGTGGTTSDGGASSDRTGGVTSGSGTTYQGDVAQTRWGPVQVAIEVADGRIVDVTILQVPDGNHRDQEINDYAVPILRQATLQAQSAEIDTVSGATVTSDGYRESLQSAIDAAHL